MNNHVFKKIELTGTSSISIEHAVSTAIAKAAQTMHNIQWFEVLETRGYVENGKVTNWQVTINLGFKLD